MNKKKFYTSLTATLLSLTLLAMSVFAKELSLFGRICRIVIALALLGVGVTRLFGELKKK